MVRGLVQYVKYGSCSSKILVPLEASWFTVKSDHKDSRVKPESSLTPEEVKAMIDAAENECHRVLVSILFEATLRTRRIPNHDGWKQKF